MINKNGWRPIRRMKGENYDQSRIFQCHHFRQCERGADRSRHRRAGKAGCTQQGAQFQAQQDPAGERAYQGAPAGDSGRQAYDGKRNP